MAYALPLNDSSGELFSTTEFMTTNENTTDYRSVYDEYGYFNVIIVATIMSIIAFIGLIGNTLVFVAVSLSRKLHTVTNAFIINLSICDFIACFVLPFQVVAVISDDGWPLMDWVCKTVASTTVITQTCGILTLAVIAINRHILITKSRKFYMRAFTDFKVGMMIAFTWLFPFIVLLVPQFFLGGLGYRQKFRICIWNSEHPLALIFQGIGALALFVSTVIIIFCYVSIFLFIRKHMRVMRNKEKKNQEDAEEPSMEIVEEESSLNDNNKVNVARPSVSTLSRKKTISRKQIDITKNLLAVVVTFFICVLPYTIHLPTGIYDMRGTYFALIFMSHACINPIIYAAKHPHFKIVFSCMFRCKYSEIPMPTIGLKKIRKLSTAAYSTGVSSNDVKYS